MGYIDTRENLKSGDVMGLWIDKSEQADQSSTAQQKTSLEPTGVMSDNSDSGDEDSQVSSSVIKREITRSLHGVLDG